MGLCDPWARFTEQMGWPRDRRWVKVSLLGILFSLYEGRSGPCEFDTFRHTNVLVPFRFLCLLTSRHTEDLQDEAWRGGWWPFLAAEAWVRSQSSSCMICGEQLIMGQIYFKTLPFSYISINPPFSFVVFIRLPTSLHFRKKLTDSVNKRRKE